MDGYKKPIGAVIYKDCWHSWWHKLWADWIRFRRHPPAHVLHYSAFYEWFKDEILKSGIDLNADTIRVRLDSSGRMDID